MGFEPVAKTLGNSGVPVQAGAESGSLDVRGVISDPVETILDAISRLSDADFRRLVQAMQDGSQRVQKTQKAQ